MLRLFHVSHEVFDKSAALPHTMYEEFVMSAYKEFITGGSFEASPVSLKHTMLIDVATMRNIYN